MKNLSNRSLEANYYLQIVKTLRIEKRGVLISLKDITFMNRSQKIS